MAGSKPNFVRITEMVLKCDSSASINELIPEAIERARQWDQAEQNELTVGEGVLISFKWKGVKVSVRRDSDPGEISDSFEQALRSRTGSGQPTVGPYVSRSKMARQKGVAEEVERYRQHHIHTLQIAAAGKPDEREVLWSNIQQGMSSAFLKRVRDVAEAWMYAMQQQFDEGSTSIGQVATQAAETVGIDELKNSRIAAAVAYLGDSQWEFGSDLYRWYFTTIMWDAARKSN